VREETSSIPIGRDVQYDFGRAARAATISGWFKLETESFPGPDSYLPNSTFGAAPKYTFGGRPEQKGK
jgi:hypothetical protein